MTSTQEHSKSNRAFASHRPKWQRYQTTLMKTSTKSASQMSDVPSTLHPYQRQYAHVYHQRLALLKPQCWRAVESDSHGSNVTKINRVLELREGVASVLVGTLVKHSNADDSQIIPNCKCKDSDTLYLEDESGRVELHFNSENLSKHQHCTGTVLAVQGTVSDKGVLVVDKVYYPVLPVHPAVINSAGIERSPHLLLLSGLHCGDPNSSSLPRQMLLHYLQGNFFNDDSNEGLAAAARVSRVIIAGNSVCSYNDANHSKIGMHNAASLSLDGVKELDAFCVQLICSGIPVDILPGKNDPTTANWPQRPLMGSLLNYSTKFMDGKLLNRTPNPYGACHGDKYILGTGGENVQDLTRSILSNVSSSDTTKSDSKDEEINNKTVNLMAITEMEALHSTLTKFCHICPTGPDSVPTIPHPEVDPMVIEDMPHIYFAGNCKQFATKTFESITQGENVKCRLICLPKFAETGEAVLVNLDTLDVEVLQFDEPN